MVTGPRDEAVSWDEALARLEDFVLAYPRDRALPDLDEIIREAQVPERFLREDERAHKVLLEAISGRPLSSLERVAQVRTEVELLTLEVDVLSDRLGDPTSPAAEAERAAARLAEVRRRLRDIRSEL